MKPPKVLIVDDEREFAATLAERLNLRKFEATAVFCAEDGLTLIRTEESPPDVVLLDLKMPSIDGKSALVAIKRYDPSIEVIIITGHGDSKDVADIGRAAFDYIMKPVDIADLVGKITQAAAKRRRGQGVGGESA
jgi:DNA-binding NtrC family response regulator